VSPNSRLKQLDLIYDISKRFSSSQDVCAQLAMIVKEAGHNFDADAAWLFLDTFNGKGPWIVSQPPNAPFLGRINRELIQAQIAVDRSALFDDLRQQSSLAGLEQFGPLLCTMLKTEKQNYGALCLGRRPGKRPFKPGDLRLANVLAIFASLALENYYFFQEKLAEARARFRMEEEVRLAVQIQDALLPKQPPEVPGYELAGAAVPFRGVGGDYYDFIELEGGRLALGLGDVTGKGLSAGLLMANLQGIIRSQAIQLRPVEECVRLANRLIFSSTGAERFITFFFGILDPGRHLFSSTNAGHDLPLLIRAEGGVERLQAGGIVLGVLEDAPYSAEEVELRPGDGLIIFSDGLVEAENAAGEEFGVDRVIRYLRQNRSASAGDTIKGLLAAVQDFVAPAQPRDDMALIWLRRLG